MDKPYKKCCFNNKKITLFCLFLSILAIFFQVLPILIKKNVAYAARNYSSAIVIEQHSGRILFGENVDAPLPIASTTKILTALTVIDSVKNIDEAVTVPKEAVGIEGSSIYLVAGETLSYRELLYGLMLRSGNDAAVTLAISVAGNVPDFVKLMNDKAKECGAFNCIFTNPHGLHDDKHLCSALGLAKITAVALARPDFKEIVSTKTIKISGDPVRYLHNKNKMLSNFEGANGVKTGFTKKSGRCLVTSAERDGMQLISVVLNHGDMWNDSKNMLERAFAEYKMHTLSDGEPLWIDVEKGKYKKVMVQAEHFKYPLTDEEYKKIKINTDLPASLTAPVNNNQNIGKISVFCDDCLLFSSNFYTISNIKKKGF